LVLNQDLDKPLVVRVEGVPKFRALPGSSKGNKAFQVLDTDVTSASTRG
jgi:flagellar motor switch protein FliM